MLQPSDPEPQPAPTPLSRAEITHSALADRLAGTIPSPVLLLDGDLTIVRANAACCELLEIRGDGGGAGHPLTEAVPGLGSDSALNQALQALRSNDASHLNLTVNYATGPARPLQLRVNASRIAEDPALILLTFERQVETEWTQGDEGILARVLASMTEGVSVANEEGFIVYTNPAEDAMFGYAPGELLGKHVSVQNAYPPEENLRRVGEVIDCLKSRGEWIGDWENVRKDGTAFVTRSRITALELSGRQHWVCVQEDITSLRNVESGLSRQYAINRTITDNAASCLFMMDERGYASFMNPAAEAVTGYTLDELRDRPLHDYIHHIRPDGTPFPHSECPLGIAWLELRPLKLHRDTFVRKDGALFPVACSMSPVQQGERNLGAVLEFRDITEELAAEEALRLADRRKDEFLAMLAHELRNPLGPVVTAIEVLRERGVGDPDVERAHEIVDRQVRHMARLVDDLLDVARISRGAIELRKEVVDLRSVVEHASLAATSGIEARGQRFTLSLPPEPVWVEADPTRLEQVVVNLLNNAAKYTPDGGEIILSLEPAHDGGDEQAVIHVRDTGIGIAPELLPHIFELFMQADRSLDRSQGGLGIGLTLVRQLVTMHGGSVEAHSTGTDEGSEFVVRLPLARTAQAAAIRAPEPPRSRITPLQVLVVDDNRDAADTLAELLRLWGHTVLVAYDGVSALRAAAAAAPEVVLLDIGLPEMDGYEVTRRLRAQPGGSGLRILALTGYGHESDRRRAQEAGFNAHLVKPVSPEQLRAALRQ